MTPDDHVLMAEVKRGDEQAFATLVSRYERSIARYVRSIVRDVERARDLTQETFLKVWLKADRFEPRGPFKAWLYRVARNLALSELRKARVRSFVCFGGIFDTLEQSSPERSPEQLTWDGELRALLLGELETLPAKLRESFVLAEVEGLTIAEVARVMASPEGTIKARLHRARRKLRDRLCERFGPEAHKTLGDTFALGASSGDWEKL